MKNVWVAHVRTPEENDLSEEFLFEPPRACLCCHRRPEMVERDLLYAYQGLKDTTKGEKSVEDHLLASFTQGASNLHSDEDMEDKIKLLDPRVQKLIRTHLEVFGELPPPASCDKLVQMDFKLKPEFVGHGGDPIRLLKSRPMRLSDRYKNVSTLAYSWRTRTGTTPNTAAPVSWWLNLGLQPNGW